MKRMKQRFKKGVASFYIVAFSTLILVIIAASFAMVIISAVSRTSNDDLSQSAYDSALAGVEDAKIAFSNYRRCVKENPTLNPTTLSTGNDVTCQDIIYWMNNPDCDMVGHILGRIPKDESGEVVVSDTVSSADGDVTSDLNQAYTCVQIKTTLDDYRATLTTTNQVRMVKVQFDDVAASSITSVRVSWYSNRADTSYNYSNFINTGSSLFSSNWRVAFQPATTMRVSAPPTLEVQMIQTAQTFSLSDFDIAVGNRTNRATVYLVPNYDANSVSNTISSDYYVGVWNGSANIVSADQIVKTNDRKVKNKPYGVYCADPSTAADADAEFACSVVLNLPQPVINNGNGTRSNDTFMFALALPYNQPDTDFSLEFCTSTEACLNVDLDSGTNTGIASIKDSQVVIDSTGRANDLYRRVETRLESADTSFAYPYYAIQLLGDDNENALEKDMTVTTEYNFNYY